MNLTSRKIFLTLKLNQVGKDKRLWLRNIGLSPSIMWSKELKSKVTQLDRKVTGRKGNAAQIADEVIAKGRRFYFVYLRKIGGKNERLVQSFPRTCRELRASDPYLTSSGMPGTIPTDKASETVPSTFIAAWPSYRMYYIIEIGYYYTILHFIIQVPLRSCTTGNLNWVASSIPGGTTRSKLPVISGQ